MTTYNRHQSSEVVLFVCPSCDRGGYWFKRHIHMPQWSGQAACLECGKIMHRKATTTGLLEDKYRQHINSLRRVGEPGSNEVRNLISQIQLDLNG